MATQSYELTFQKPTRYILVLSKPPYGGIGGPVGTITRGTEVIEFVEYNWLALSERSMRGKTLSGVWLMDGLTEEELRRTDPALYATICNTLFIQRGKFVEMPPIGMSGFPL